MKINNILTLFIFSTSLLLACYSTKETSNTKIVQNDSTFIEKTAQNYKEYMRTHSVEEEEKEEKVYCE